MRIVLALALLSVPAVALAAEDPQPRPTDPKTVQCKAVREVGSRIPVRRCKTLAEWKREEEAVQASIATRNRNSRCSGSGTC